MADPIISPDGKWMWTGSEWIPAAPSSPTVNTSEVKLQDSVISGDVSINSTTIVESVDAKVVEAAMMGVQSIVSNIGSDNELLHGWELNSYPVAAEEVTSHSVTRTELKKQVAKIIQSGGHIVIYPPTSHFNGTYKGVLTNQQINIRSPCLSFEIGGNPGDIIVNVSNSLPGTIVEYSAVSLDTQIGKERVLSLVDGLLAREYSIFKSDGGFSKEFAGTISYWCPYGEFPTLKKLYRSERNAIWWSDKEHEYAEQPLWITLISAIMMVGSVSFVGFLFFANPLG
jgi:hypothetical protein